MMRGSRLLLGLLVATATFLISTSQLEAYIKQSFGTGVEIVLDSASFEDGSIVTTGYFTNTAQFGQTQLVSNGHHDIFIAKVNSSGDFVWAVSVGSTSSDQGWGVDALSNGEVIVTGIFRGTVHFGTQMLSTQNLQGGTFVAKLDEYGNFVWAVQLGAGGHSQGLDIASFVDDSFVVAGIFTNTGIFGETTLSSSGSDDIFVTKFSSSGIIEWTTRFGGNGSDFGYGIATYSDKSMVVSGYYGASNLSAYTVRIGPNGDVLWERITSSSGGAVAAHGVTGLPDGSAIIMGYLLGEANFDGMTLTPSSISDVFVAKLDHEGNYLWAKQSTNGSSTYVPVPWRISSNYDGSEILITGDFQQSITFGGVTLFSYVNSTNSFIVKLSKDGSFLWAKNTGGGPSNSGRNATFFRNSANISFVGSFGGTVNYPNVGQLSYSGAGDMFMLTLDSYGNYLSNLNSKPTAVIEGYLLGLEGIGINFSGTGSSDPDGVEDIVSYEWDFGDGNFGSGMDVTHVYADNGIYTVTLTVTDSQGASDSDSVVVTVVNVAPVVNVPDTLQVFEMGTINVSASFTDPGDDSWVGSVDYGDGSTNEDLVFVGKNFDLDHTYELPGIYTVTVTIADDDGGVGVGVFEVATYSVSVSVGSNVSVTLGGVTIVFDEVETAGIVTFDITSHPQGGLPPSQYRFLGMYYEITTTAIYSGQITITFSYDEADVHGQEDNLKLFHWEGSGWQDITVPPVDTVNNTITGTTYTLSPFAIGDLLNLPPTVTAEGPYQVEEGGVVELTAVGYDPEGGLLIYAWDLDADGFFESVGQTVNFSAAALDGPSTHAVSVQVADEGGLTATDEAEIIVLNVAPVIGEIVTTSGPVMVGTEVSASADFSDSGLLDTHFAEWRWGDGTVSEGAVSVSAGGGYVGGLHTYIYPGVYTLTLTVTDDDGDYDTVEYAYVVVYDPEGGFVTGGGWFNSPLGAYTLNPLASGKANFGFNSKYLPGAQVPTGNTEFRFKSANLDFHSTSYEWLVVAGAQAKYKGIGNLNGDSNYGFMLSARDSAVSGGGQYDAFRIKIWEISTGQIIYDNQLGDSDDADASTQIGGGNVVIHK